MLICKDGCGAENVDGATQCQRCGRSLNAAIRVHNPGTLVRHYRIKRVKGFWPARELEPMLAYRGLSGEGLLC